MSSTIWFEGILYELLNGHTDFSKAKSGFLSGRGKSTTIYRISPHAVFDHPKRKFDFPEIKRLLKESEIVDVVFNDKPSATPGSILVIVMDDYDDECQFPVNVYYNKKAGNYITVLTAIRDDKT